MCALLELSGVTAGVGKSGGECVKPMWIPELSALQTPTACGVEVKAPRVGLL